MATWDQYLNTRKWSIRNEDTDETLQGQFSPQSLTQEVGNNWAQHTALNRANTIIQYLNSKADTLSFQGMFFTRDTSVSTLVQERIDKLISWARRDPDLGRPPIVTFWVGNGYITQQSVIEGISGIEWGEADILGHIRTVSFTVNMIQYIEFDFNATEVRETRYHKARDRDYFEFLTQREYGNPSMGDVIRKRHPELAVLTPGDTVKLPTFAAIRTDKVTQKSIALQGAFGRKDTPQRILKNAVFDRNNRAYVSHVVVG